MAWIPNLDVDWNTGNVINVANDDVLWWVMTFIRAYDDFHDPWYLQQAESTFASVCVQWNLNSTCNGGVVWGDWTAITNDQPSEYENAITNELFLQAATKLALRDPNHQSVCGTLPGVVPSGQMSVAWDTSIPLTACVNAPDVQCVNVTLPDSYEGWAWAEYQWFNTYFLSQGLTIRDRARARRLYLQPRRQRAHLQPGSDHRRAHRSGDHCLGDERRHRGGHEQR